MTPQELSDRLWQFAARIGKVVDALPGAIANNKFTMTNFQFPLPAGSLDIRSRIMSFPSFCAFAMQHQYMQRFVLILICSMAFLAVPASADTYTLSDGTKI